MTWAASRPGTWVTDEDFSGGSTAATNHAISTTGVTNPAPRVVYQTNRIFNVLIDETQVLTNFDIFATVGGEYNAVVEQFTETAASNGMFTAGFVTLKDNPK